MSQKKRRNTRQGWGVEGVERVESEGLEGGGGKEEGHLSQI